MNTIAISFLHPKRINNYHITFLYYKRIKSTTIKEIIVSNVASYLNVIDSNKQSHLKKTT